jgi:uncharacterized membrane protein
MIAKAARDVASSFREAFTVSRNAQEILEERYARGEIGREE